MLRKILVFLTLILLLVCCKKATRVNLKIGKVSSLYGIYSEQPEIRKLLKTNANVIDSVVADFNRDSYLDFAIVIEDTLHKVNEYEYRMQFKPKTLLVCFNDKQEGYNLVYKNDDLFQSNQQRWNWGVNGNDAFIGIDAVNNQLCFSFLSGGTLMLEEYYSFGYDGKQFWKLMAYESKTYDMLEVSNSGEIEVIKYKHCDYVANKILSYEIKHGVYTDSIYTEKELIPVDINGFNAWKGVEYRPF